jgi:hypothetical protein
MLPGIDLFFSEIEFEPLIRGDYNGNKVVDQLDYTVWRSSFGSSTALAADGNFNGIVDAADYVIWRRNSHADSTNPSKLSAAPEPPTVTFVLAVSVCLSLCRNEIRRCHLNV